MVELGRAARAESKVKTRQPLARALISAANWEAVPEQLQREVREELNVMRLDNLHDADAVIAVTIKPNFRSLGARYGASTKAVAALLAAENPATVAADLRADRPVVLHGVDGAEYELGAADVIVNQSPAAGWTVASDGPETVALDLELTADLRRRGHVREVVRDVQEARKNAGFDVSDRIELHWMVGGSPDPAEAIEAHADEIAAEVLATTPGPRPAGRRDHRWLGDGRGCRSGPGRLAAPHDGLSCRQSAPTGRFASNVERPDRSGCPLRPGRFDMGSLLVRCLSVALAGAVVATVVQVAQLRLEVALQAGAVLALERAQLGRAASPGPTCDPRGRPARTRRATRRR